MRVGRIVQGPLPGEEGRLAAWSFNFRILRRGKLLNPDFVEQVNRVTQGRSPVHPKPIFPLAVSRQHLVDLVPESVRVIAVSQVAEFVYYNVVNDSLRSHQRLPMEVQCAAHTARCPMVAQFFDGNFTRLQVDFGGGGMSQRIMISSRSAPAFRMIGAG